MIKVYQKQPIQAEQFDEAKWQAIYDNFNNPEEWNIKAQKFGIYHYHGYFIIPTHEGDIRVHDGDWIATGINGENWPIADDIFRKNYAELPVIPDVVAEYISAVKNGETDLEDITAVEAALGAIEYDQASHIEAEWIQQHGDEFARAWLDGYQVEEDK